MKTYLKFGLLIAVILGTLLWLAMGGISETKTYYKTIAELNQLGDSGKDHRLRVGGDVADSIHREGREVRFTLTQDKLVLPVDHVVVSEIKENAESALVETIPDGKIGVDIGPLTIDHYSHVIRTAKTVIWNGPMGVFEKKPFDRGTVALAKAVAVSGATSVVGGGDSEKAIKSAGVAEQISHISTGGGASLEFLAGIELPGVAALADK